jgi:hypothetical protein
MLMYVDAEALNLRSEPEISPQTKLGILHLCQPVDMLGQTAAPGWVRVSARAPAAISDRPAPRRRASGTT